jgi:hypothetical protein
MMTGPQASMMSCGQAGHLAGWPDGLQAGCHACLKDVFHREKTS